VRGARALCPQQIEVLPAARGERNAIDDLEILHAALRASLEAHTALERGEPEEKQRQSVVHCHGGSDRSVRLAR
jgi:hypothetical protein